MLHVLKLFPSVSNCRGNRYRRGVDSNDNPVNTSAISIGQHMKKDIETCILTLDQECTFLPGNQYDLQIVRI